jgi:hypothetical protein
LLGGEIIKFIIKIFRHFGIVARVVLEIWFLILFGGLDQAADILSHFFDFNNGRRIGLLEILFTKIHFSKLKKSEISRRKRKFK